MSSESVLRTLLALESSARLRILKQLATQSVSNSLRRQYGGVAHSTLGKHRGI